MRELDKINFAKAFLNETYDLGLIHPVNEGLALDAVVSEIENTLSLNSSKVMRSRHSYFNIPGTSPHDYQEKFFELSSSRIFLSGVRHRGGNPNLPFVSIMPSFKLDNQNIFEVLDLVKKEYRSFQPKHVAFWTKSSREEHFLSSRCKPARRYMVQKIENLILDSSLSSSVELKPIKNDTYFKWYKSEYQKFHVSHPDLKNWVTISNKEDLERYRKQKLLYGAYLNHDLIGLVGGEKENLLGLQGLYIGEILVSERNQGKGLAVEMQRQFLQRLAAHYEVVWGTIDAKNIASTKTALRVGRIPIRTEFFLTLT